jgi:hypothetical protein
VVSAIQRTSAKTLALQAQLADMNLAAQRLTAGTTAATKKAAADKQKALVGKRALEQKLAERERAAAQTALEKQTAEKQIKAVAQKALNDKRALEQKLVAQAAQHKQALDSLARKQKETQQKVATQLAQQQQAAVVAAAKLARANDPTVICANCGTHYREADNTRSACTRTGPHITEYYHPKEWNKRVFSANVFPCCGDINKQSKGCRSRSGVGPPTISRHYSAAAGQVVAQTSNIEVRIGGNLYDINIDAKTQTNRSTRFVRTIREGALSWEFEDGSPGSGNWKPYDDATARKINQARLLIPIPRADSADQIKDPDPCFKQLWASSAKRGRDKEKLFLVHQGGPEYIDIAGQFTRTLPSATIVRIDRVENGPMRQAFALQASSLTKQIGAGYDASTMQQRLFHGTQAVEAIVNSTDGHGFLPLLAGSAVGAIYGDGTYFARDASYSNAGYARKLQNGQKQMLLVDVLVGRSEKGEKGMKMTSLIPGEQHIRYNSFVNDVSDPSIFVVQHSNHAYPAYLITYKK